MKENKCMLVQSDILPLGKSMARWLDGWIDRQTLDIEWLQNNHIQMRRKRSLRKVWFTLQRYPRILPYLKEVYLDYIMTYIAYVIANIFLKTGQLQQHKIIWPCGSSGWTSPDCIELMEQHPPCLYASASWNHLPVFHKSQHSQRLWASHSHQCDHQYLRYAKE